MVVPMQLNLPAKNQQPEKHHSVLLMLTASFRCCSGPDECKDTKPCFACHDLILQHQKRYIRGTYITRWKRLKARMQVLNQSAMERSMASLSVHSVQDLIGMREWFPSMATDATPDEQQEHLGRKTEARFRMWFLKQMAGRYRWKHAEDPFAGVDLPRIHERITTFLEGAYVGFHYGQLTPQEFYAMVTDTWLRRYVSFHEARATNSSQRRAERFRYMGDVANDDPDVVDGDGGQVELVGDDVDDDLSLDIAAEKMEMARHPVNQFNLEDILYRRTQWEQILKSKKEQTNLRVSLQKLTDLFAAIGGIPQRQPCDRMASSESFVKVGDILLALTFVIDLRWMLCV